MNFKDHDPMLARWLTALQHVGPMIIEYRKGKMHQNADSLSRRVTRKCRNDGCKDCHKTEDDRAMDERIDDLLLDLQEKEMQCLGVETQTYELEELLSILEIVEPCEETLKQSDNLDSDELDDLVLSMENLTINEKEKENMEELFELAIPGYSLEELKDLQQSDPSIRKYMELRQTLEFPIKKDRYAELGLTDGVRKLCLIWNRLEEIDGILYMTRQRSGEKCKRLVTPYAIRKELLRYIHGVNVTAHQGEGRSLQLITAGHYWPGMGQEIRDWVSSCLPCNLVKRGKSRGKAPLHLEIPSIRMERVSFDIVIPGGISERGFRYILVLIDFFTKFANAIPLKDHKAETVAKALWSGWIKTFGCPRRFHSDRGAEFEGTVIQQLCKLLEITKTRTTPFHPQSDGQCERTNQTLEKMLKVLCQEHREDWDLYLDYCVSAYNSTPSRATGYSPHYLMFGEEKVMPVNIIYGQHKEAAPEQLASNCYCEYVQDLRKKLDYSYGLVHKRLGRYSRRMKIYYDTGLKETEFQPGDWVIRYYAPAKADVLGFPARGPYVVEKRNSRTVYTIREEQNAKPLTVHVNDLRICKAMRGISNWILDKAPEQESQNTEIMKKVHDTGVQTKVAKVSQATQYNEKDLLLRRSTRVSRPPEWLQC